jgi:Carboxypeptidase regulatory-like domain
MRKYIRMFCSLRFTGLLLVCALAGHRSQGQVDQGGIAGIVTDSQQRAVQGATVTLVNQATNLMLTRETGNSGAYTFAPIKIGSYTVTVKAGGFRTIVRENINVNVSETVGLNLELQLGEVTDTVTVTSTPSIQTEDASTGQVFNSQVINDTPLNGRNYVFIAQLTTGVAAPNQGFRQVAGSGDFTSNGGRVSQNNFLLDGVDNNSNMQDFLNGATYAVRPPPDALEEFKVENSDYSAELGRGAGAAINASIKSGTNNIHGSLWEYFSDDRLDARDYFNTKGTSAYRQNEFGATLGGPIVKDKLFFFADAQGYRISQFAPPIPNRNVPTDAMRNGDFTQFFDPNNTQGRGSIGLYLPGGNPTVSAGGAEDPNGPKRYLTCNGVRNVICPNQINPIAQRIFKLFPEPNVANPNQVFRNYTVPATSVTINTTQYDARLDYNFSSKDQMFGRYSYSNNPSTYASPFGPILDGGGFGGDGQSSNYGKSGVVSETHFFSQTFSNEFRVGFNWLYASYLQPNSQANLAAQYGLGGIPSGPNLGGFPQIGFGSGSNGIGVDNYLPSSERQNVLQIIDNVSKVLGRHTIKTGINLQHVRFYLLQPPSGIGSQNFSGRYTSDPGLIGAVSGSGYADFLMDMMTSSNINTITPITNLRWYYSAFAQDDWKVTPKLTLNLGLRWEYTQPQSVLHGAQANFIGSYANFNQGTGTYLIPQSQSNVPFSQKQLSLFAADRINIQYTTNNYLVEPQKFNFAPRIGIAYLIDPKTVVRAGGGIFYGGLENIGGGLNLGNNAPFYVNASFSPTPNVCTNIQGTVTCPTNGQTLETGFTNFLNSPSSVNNSISTIYANDQKMKTANTVAYNLTMQHSFTDSLSFTVGYQGNESRHLRASYNANTYKGAIPNGQNGQNYQAFHDFSVVNVASSGIARYDSLQTKLEKRYSNGLYFLAGYTWAHCLDDAFGPIGQSQYGGYRNPTFLGFRYDYGACTQDVRNRFTLSPHYELPFGKGKAFLNHGGIVNELIGGLKSSAIFQAQSGNPVFLTSTNQGSSYPIRIGDPFAPGGTPDPATQPNFNCATQTRTKQQWFNPCAFINPPQAVLNNGVDIPSKNLIDASHAGTIPFGPSGRQAIYGPGFFNLDMSLFKSFAIPFHESSLQFRVDAFNLLNHPSFGNPGSGLSGTNSQSITSTRFSGLFPDARVLQLSLRLSY